MRGRYATGRFCGAVLRNAAIAAVIAGLFTGAVGFASADDPAVPPAPATVPPTPPVPLTTVPVIEAPPAVPVIPSPTSNPAPSAPQTPIPVTTLFTLTTMPNAWASTPNILPALEVQSDGRALKRQDGKELNGTVPADVLAAAATEVRALALSDMGSPTVSDQGNMIIDFMPKSPDQDVHLIVYAPEFTDGLTDEQKASRKRFADLYQRLLNAFVAS
ncbi:hypothetical protein OHB26_25895 [Nocardia sp. NBC_01503]|uniref:hypothetical protein n=1 Tax=Nocardia sp. NBC_01503 TaxID=2975997 RepID=UPI002E7BFC0E|nr:hypothetical protein [Nocardia sp. NBC_01503]WTL30361.1 hypothetical protein OHB26_25895 [Nocardia sp. NBC_01503]